MTGTVLSWSGGKDAARALHELRDRGADVDALLTTIGAETGRSSMHGVHRSLYERQAAALDEALQIVELPPAPDNDTYETVMATVVEEHVEAGVERMAFADLFLEDVREYREERLAGTGLEPCFPIWGRDTAATAEAFIDDGYQATVVAVDADLLDATVVGRPFDHAFLDALPEAVDPCGEHGSFHTFVHDGPIFDEPVPVEVGDVETRPVGDGEFHYADLLLADR